MNSRLQNLVQLHLNRTFDQLSPPTPPAIVSRERRAAPAQPPPSPATSPTTVPIRRSVPIPALIQSGSVSSVPQWQNSFQSSRITSHQPQATPFHAFARSSTLLPLFFTPASFIFNRLRTLLRKHRGWHTPPRSSGVTPAESQVTSVVRKNAKKLVCKSFACHSYALPVA